MHPGEGVGEIALLTNEPRSATVMARLDSEVIRFPHATFIVLAAGHHWLCFKSRERPLIALWAGSIQKRKSASSALSQSFR